MDRTSTRCQDVSRSKEVFATWTAQLGMPEGPPREAGTPAYAGIAVGSLLGGRILERHGVSYVVLVSIAVCALAAPLTWGTQFLKPSVAAKGARPLR